MRLSPPALLALSFSASLFALAACGSDPEATLGATADASPVLPGDDPDAGAPDAKVLEVPSDAADAGTPDAAQESTDGICTPSPVTTGVYDPDCVYLVGSALPGSAGYDILVDPAVPNVRAHGFGYYFSSPVVRPKDGRLVWRTFDELWVFQPDTVALGAQENVVVANDDAVATPGCPEGVAHAFVFPDDSKVAYQCFQSRTNPDFAQHVFVEGASTPLASGGAGIFPIGVGNKRAVLFRAQANGELSVFDGATKHPVVGSATPGYVAAVRFRGGAFRVAQWRTGDGGSSLDLLRVAVDGTMTVVGTYSLGSPAPSIDRCVLEPSDGLVCFTWGVSESDKIVRFSLGAAPQLLFDETGQPVQIHISDLVTGP